MQLHAKCYKCGRKIIQSYPCCVIVFHVDNPSYTIQYTIIQVIHLKSSIFTLQRWRNIQIFKGLFKHARKKKVIWWKEISATQDISSRSHIPKRQAM